MIEYPCQNRNCVRCIPNIRDKECLWCSEFVGFSPSLIVSLPVNTTEEETTIDPYVVPASKEIATVKRGNNAKKRKKLSKQGSTRTKRGSANRADIPGIQHGPKQDNLVDGILENPIGGATRSI